MLLALPFAGPDHLQARGSITTLTGLLAVLTALATVRLALRREKVV